MEVSATSKESGWSWALSCLLLSMIFLLDFGTVLTMWYYCFHSTGNTLTIAILNIAFSHNRIKKISVILSPNSIVS